MKYSILISVLIFVTGCAGYIPHDQAVMPVFNDSKKLDVTYSFNVFSGEVDDDKNLVSNDTFWHYDELRHRLKQDLTRNPMIRSVKYSENAKPDSFHLDIEFYFGKQEQGALGMALTIITLGLIPSYNEVERTVLIKVRDPDGFPAGKITQESGGTMQLGWFTLFQGSTLLPDSKKGTAAILKEVSEGVAVALYKLDQKGTFSGNF
jgi:hypothetical protein